MTPWSPAIRRLAAMTLMLMLIVGMMAWSYLPFSNLFNDGSATIQVQTYYPGASSAMVNSTVTGPLEKQLEHTAGVRQVSTRSTIGRSVITVRFEPSITVDVARQNIQAVIDAAIRLLPDDLQMPPLVVAE